MCTVNYAVQRGLTLLPVDTTLLCESYCYAVFWDLFRSCIEACGSECLTSKTSCRHRRMCKI